MLNVLLKTKNFLVFYSYLKSPNNQTAFFKPITGSEIQKKINDMRNETNAFNKYQGN